MKMMFVISYEIFLAKRKIRKKIHDDDERAGSFVAGPVSHWSVHGSNYYT